MSTDLIEQYNFWAALLVGFLSSGHCVVMCGGVVGVLSANIPLHHNHGIMRLMYLSCYNVGRILSYCIAGALLGFSIGFFALKSNILFSALQLLSAIMLIGIGLYICQWVNFISQVEKLGKGLWRVIAPFANRFIPLKSPINAIPFGFVWGWLPCGLVYSTLTWSAASASAFDGALIMLGFGLGTLPTLLAIGVFSAKLNSLLTSMIFRQLAGIAIIVFGLRTLWTGL